MTSKTLQVNQSALSDRLQDSWIERLFQRMEDRYGKLWADKYGQFPRERVKQSWAEDLADMTGKELAHGLEACKKLKFPPTLPEFIMLCRPPIDYEATFIETMEQLRKRSSGEDCWSHPAVYWAAQSIGQFDLFAANWQTIKTRWTKVLDEMLAEKNLPVVPVYVRPLPAPGKTSIDQATAQKRIKKIAEEALKNPSDYKQWARKILANPKQYSEISLRFAMEALESE